MTDRGNAAVSLNDFAATQRAPGGKTCLVCELPPEVRKQLEASKGTREAPGVSYKIMGEWLSTVHGITNGTRGRLERHWQDGHAA